MPVATLKDLAVLPRDLEALLKALVELPKDLGKQLKDSVAVRHHKVLEVRHKGLVSSKTNHRSVVTSEEEAVHYLVVILEVRKVSLHLSTLEVRATLASRSSNSSSLMPSHTILRPTKPKYLTTFKTRFLMSKSYSYKVKTTWAKSTSLQLVLGMEQSTCLWFRLLINNQGSTVARSERQPLKSNQYVPHRLKALF